MFLTVFELKFSAPQTFTKIYSGVWVKNCLPVLTLHTANEDQRLILARLNFKHNFFGEVLDHYY